MNGAGDAPVLTGTSESILGALVARIDQRLASGGNSKNRVLIGICGTPASGKSTLAAGLAAEIGPERAAVVPLDGFHLARRSLNRLGLSAQRGAIETFDVGGFRALLERLIDRSEPLVYIPDYERELHEPVAASLTVHRSVEIIIVEGNYLLSTQPDWQFTRELLDEIWYLDVDAETRRTRLIARHIRFGKSEEEAVAKSIGSDARNAHEIDRGRERSDLIIVNKHPDGAR